MHQHFNPRQMLLLFGGAVLVISVLLLGLYFLQRSIGRTLKPEEPKPARVPVENEAEFTLATVKGVIAQLKTDQKATQEKLTVAERRAEASGRKFELLAREIDCGLIVFDAAGFITFSNPQVRTILSVDTWSRRRHGEIFRDIPVLAKLISECFENATEVRKSTIEFQGADGSQRRLEVSVLPIRDRSGIPEAVVCFFRELAPPGMEA